MYIKVCANVKVYLETLVYVLYSMLYVLISDFVQHMSHTFLFGAHV